jgi:hypothetical protein
MTENLHWEYGANHSVKKKKDCLHPYVKANHSATLWNLQARRKYKLQALFYYLSVS